MLTRCAIGIAVHRAGIGKPDHDQQQRHRKSDATCGDQCARPADAGDQRRHDRRSDRAAEKAGEAVDRKRPAHPRLVHVGGEDRVVGGMIDAIGEAEQRGAADQGSVAEMQAEQDQRTAAQRHAEDQDLSGADAIDQIADRRLGQAGDHGEGGQREAELDIADTELRL
jgi:hypothetical protein